MLSFILGAVAGSLAMWFWGDELRRHAETGTRAVRERTADTLEAVDAKAGEVLDTARDQVHSTLTSGQEAVRPRIF
jgi:hypothetical protein